MRVKRVSTYKKIAGKRIRFSVMEYRNERLVEIYDHTCTECDLLRIKRFVSQHFTIPIGDIKEEPEKE